MTKNRTWNLLVSIFLVVPFLFVLMLTANAVEAQGDDFSELGFADGGIAPDPEDVDLWKEYGDLLSPEQLTALEEAYAQLKTSISAAEKVYQDAIKALKERYRVTVQDAVKSMEDEKELADVLERLTADILAAYGDIQKTLDSYVQNARLAFQKAADAALIPVEMINALKDWHVNKERNAANELINFIESYKNLSNNEKSGETQGNGNMQRNLTQNSEQNQEENQNQGEQQNQEQEKQKEQNDINSQNPGNQQGQPNAQTQSGQKGGKGKGGH